MNIPYQKSNGQLEKLKELVQIERDYSQTIEKNYLKKIEFLEKEIFEIKNIIKLLQKKINL